MPRIQDLPLAAIGRIIRLARGRCIAGCNVNAIVCRQWRAASSSSEESEQVQLYLHLGLMPSKYVDRAAAWLALYGRHVEVLVLHPHMVMFLYESPVLWLQPVAAGFINIRRLEFNSSNSLVLLAPVLGQLPHLQKLAARVMLESVHNLPLQVWDEEPRTPGVFVTECAGVDKPLLAWDLPDLQQLCPALTGLHLWVDPVHDELDMDPRLPCLLPPRLKQLTLTNHKGHRFSLWVASSCLSHLTALQQLMLEQLMLDGPGQQAMATHLGSLPALQQVKLRRLRPGLEDSSELLQLASKVTEYEVACSTNHEGMPWPESTAFGVVTRFSYLTRLELHCGMGIPQGTKQALAALTGLQELELRGPTLDQTCVAAVKQAALLPSLHHLHMPVGSTGDPEEKAASEAIQGCTQLTSLELKEGTNWLRAGFWAASLQHLTGLRSLLAPSKVLVHQGAPWLAPMRHLVTLQVWLPVFERLPDHLRCAPDAARQQWQQQQMQQLEVAARGVLQQVQEWPASLQQVVIWARPPGSVLSPQPRFWRFLPAGPGRAPFLVRLDTSGGEPRPAASQRRPCPYLPGAWELQGEAAEQ
jgi:hypothetical protein